MSQSNIRKISTWRGKKLDEYSKEELIDIVVELGQALEQEHHEHNRQLDVLESLLGKPL